MANKAVGNHWLLVASQNRLPGAKVASQPSVLAVRQFAAAIWLLSSFSPPLLHLLARARLCVGRFTSFLLVRLLLVFF